MNNVYKINTTIKADKSLCINYGSYILELITKNRLLWKMKQH